MFRKEFQSVDIDRAMQLSFDALGDLVSMHETAQAFKSAEQAAIEKTERLERQDTSQTIPAVGWTCPCLVESHCPLVSFVFEIYWAFVTKSRMPAHGIIEPVDISGDGIFGLKA